MAKRKFKLTEAEGKELLGAERLCKDGATRTRYPAVGLYGEGDPEKEIERITGCNRTSLLLPIEELQNTLQPYMPQARLGRKASTAAGQFWTVEDLVVLVRERYAVEYQSRTSYSSLLRLCGFSYQKTEKIFKSRSQTKIADFEEQLEKN